MSEGAAALRLWPLAARLSPLRERFWAIVGAPSVRAKIMGSVVACVLVLGVSVTVYVRLDVAAALERQLEARGVAIAASLASRSGDLLLTGNVYSLYALVQDALSVDPDVRYVFVVDSGGAITVHTFGESFPSDLLTLARTAQGKEPRWTPLETEEGRLRDLAMPVLGGRAGTIHLGLSEGRVDAAVSGFVGRILSATVAALVLGLGLAYGIATVLTRPVGQLVGATEAIGGGDFAWRAPVWARDEIGRLGEAFNTMAARLGEARQALDRSQAQLLARNAELAALNDELRRKEAARTLLLQKVISAQEDERRRIARELHDETSQALTTVLVGLRVLSAQRGRHGEPTTIAQVEELRQVVTTALEAVHDMAVELRPSTLDDVGLGAALARYTREYGPKHGVTVDFQSVGLEEGARLPTEIETAVYRVVQEALTNVARHAAARSASVLVERRPDRLLALVEDDGRGFDPAQVECAPDAERHLGLDGMRERAALIDGTLTIESAPGTGTTVYLEVPLPSAGET